MISISDYSIYLNIYISNHEVNYAMAYSCYSISRIGMSISKLVVGYIFSSICSIAVKATTATEVSSDYVSGWILFALTLLIACIIFAGIIAFSFLAGGINMSGNLLLVLIYMVLMAIFVSFFFTLILHS